MNLFWYKPVSRPVEQNSRVLNPKRKSVDYDEVSAVGFLEEMKNAVQGILGFWDYSSSGFPSSKNWIANTPNALYSIKTSLKTGKKMVHLQKTTGRFIIQTLSAKDKVTRETLLASKLPQTIILQKGVNIPEYDFRWELMGHDQIPYTPIKVEVIPQYKWSIVVTLEKDIGTPRRVQLIIPIRETYELSFNKNEIRELETRRKSGGGRMEFNGISIDELDFLKYGRDFIEMGTWAYYLHAGDAVQVVEIIDWKLSTHLHEIVAMATETKTVPVYNTKKEKSPNQHLSRKNTK